MIPSTIKVGAEWWVVKIIDSSEEPGKFGECDFENKCIRLSSKQSKKEMHLTLAHELLHAAVPDLVEDAVIRYEQALKSAGLLG
jgi:hypothetical protein